MDFNRIREWVDFIVQEIGRDELTGMMKSIALWGLLGAFVGLVLVFVTYRFFRRVRWYGCTSTAGRWLQRGVCVMTMLFCAFLIGGAGAWEGVHRKSHDVVTQSRIGSDVLPPIADIVAEGFAWIDLAMEPGGSVPNTTSDPRLAEFRAGEREIDVADFLQRAESLRDEGVRQLLAGFEGKVLEQTPWLQGGLVEKFLHQTIQALGPVLVDQKLSSEMRRRGFDHLRDAIQTNLTTEAARTGDPATIGYHDLSRFIQREALVPAIVVPIRSFARQQQVLYALLALFVLIVPPVIFRVCRRKPTVGAAVAPTKSAPRNSPELSPDVPSRSRFTASRFSGTARRACGGRAPTVCPAARRR